jgi:hypothetical protein
MASRLTSSRVRMLPQAGAPPGGTHPGLRLLRLDGRCDDALVRDFQMRVSAVASMEVR